MPNAIKEAVIWFFEELNKLKILYAVLRKAELIPDSIGNDIDILVKKGDETHVFDVVKKCGKTFDFWVQRRKINGLYLVLYRFFGNEIIFFRLDFTNPVKNPDKLLAKRLRNEKGIYYLPEGLHLKKKKYNLGKFFTFPKRFLQPTGKFIVILGPDGVGKSTTAEIMKQIFVALHIPVKHVHLGFRPKILPTKRNILTLGKTKESISNEESKIPGVMRFFYHTFDYFLGYFLKIRPLLVKGRYIIGERYYYSYLVDPRPIKRYGVPIWLIKLAFFFIPKPKIVILLSNDPEEIYKRRQEHSIEEISNQIKKYRELGGKEAVFIEVRTDKPSGEVAIEAVNELISRNQ